MRDYDCTVIHDEVVERVRDVMPAQTKMAGLAMLFKNFGDITRVSIMWALGESEMCVCDLAVLLGMTKSAISHQLKILRLSNLVRSRREGKVVYYSLADAHVLTIIEQGYEHICE